MTAARSAQARFRIRAALVSVLAAAAFFALGFAVSAGLPPAPDVAVESLLAGKATGLALIFTLSCYWYVLVAFGAGAIALAFMRPPWRARCAFSIVLTLVAWLSSDALKALFARGRPADWYVIQEHSRGYPSGHAMFAVVVYMLWAYFIWTGPVPESFRRPAAFALCAWAAGILWSRLALGAHYPTDLIGGLLLGVAFVAAGMAIFPIVRLKPVTASIMSRS